MRLLFLALFLLPLVSSDWPGRPEFVKKLNEKRREVAKKEEIPNMRELVWSKDLIQVSVLKDMNSNEERFIDVWGDYTYEEVSKELLEIASYIQRNNTVYKESAQYFFPLFEKIGCNLVLDEDGGNVMYCFLTPGFPKEIIELPFDTKNIFLDSGEAGSKCGTGYENNDGLCKFIEPTTTTVTTPKMKKDVPTEPSSSYSIFSMVHILVVLGFGYSIFT